MKRLGNKVAIVTGASKGIGAGIAKASGAEGAAVVVNYARDHEGAERVASHVLLAGIAAAIAIKPCHGLKRTDLKRLTEYVAGRNWPPASIATFVSKHALSPIFFDRSDISKPTPG
jgi:NAD(P)-dependent dehydrogenase (short-subunit alcohol dehydrogenase family)